MATSRITRYDERTVALGGGTGLDMRRTLPQRRISTVGPWCFVDRFGPANIPMEVLPHPHTGLQTVTWLHRGLLRHRDSIGSDATIVPGQLNLMTAGRGVSHSEMSPVETDQDLEGFQFWVALPEHTRHMQPSFQSISRLPTIRHRGLTAQVLVGEFEGVTSPAMVHSDMVGLDLHVLPRSSTEVALDPAFEYAAISTTGEIAVNGVALEAGPLYYFATGSSLLRIASREGGKLMLLGGRPFDEPLIMWWNFVGRSHNEIAAYRAQWETHDPCFGSIPFHGDARIPAPALPPGKLRPRQPRQS